jgi:hypothetical protein
VTVLLATESNQYIVTVLLAAESNQYIVTVLLATESNQYIVTVLFATESNQYTPVSQQFLMSISENNDLLNPPSSQDLHSTRGINLIMNHQSL